MNFVKCKDLAGLSRNSPLINNWTLKQPTKNYNYCDVDYYHFGS